MLRIDEAIALVNIEKECINRADNCSRKCNECDLVQDTNKLLGLYEQLAEWLEELKAFKKNKWTDIYIKRGYNKALDDFIHECDKYCEFYSGKNKSITREDILKIAEQLKAKNNERRSDGE